MPVTVTSSNWKEKNITNLTLGAYERFNYGDLLFPIVLDSIYSRLRGPHDPRQLHHCTVGKGDMTAEGGVKTQSAQQAFKTDQQSLIVGGGEILGAGWFSMWSSLQPDWVDPVVRLTRKFVPRRARERVGRRFLGGYWQYPFVPDLATVSKLGFNAIGATHSSILATSEQARLWAIVGESSLATVRDETSAEIAASFGLDLEVVPDSAAALLDLPRFSSYRSLAPVGGGQATNSVIVQMSKSWAASCTQETIDALSEIGRQCDGLTLLAVGLAGAHSDQSGLEDISKRLSCRSRLVVPRDLDEVVSYISRASVVIATSLHVNITAMASGVKIVPLAGIKKLDSYIATWGFDSETPVIGVRILDAFNSEDVSSGRSARIARAQSLSTAAQAATARVLESTFDLHSQGAG
ncbi:hypothetical protein CH300_06035 [Rhodococcus sp. 15-1154-1]|nr:polysaccharide pyruvyl transferase family protein [Rhodococcus sp. 15-1154-1]OZF07503.1 hypothetical protein CH300_06035 [Rhodococcus sp. 15-1154-1]